MILVPGILAYMILSIHGARLNPLGFIEAMGIIFINHFYFLALTLMLGTFFNNRGPVIGIPLAILFLQQNLISFLPALGYIFPWTLVVPIGNGTSLVYSLMAGATVPEDLIITLGVILGEIILFVLLGLWRFNREEF
jgi:ABC-2 type transport system permease protein